MVGEEGTRAAGWLVFHRDRPTAWYGRRRILDHIASLSPTAADAADALCLPDGPSVSTIRCGGASDGPR